jgi:hypothetical protein
MDIVSRKQINILIRLAESDKEFASEEKELILRLAKNKNFPLHEVEDLILHPEPIGSLGALSQNQKYEYLISCISLILADKKVLDNEVRFAKNIALKLDFKHIVVDFLIENIENMEKSALKNIVLKEYT